MTKKNQSLRETIKEVLEEEIKETCKHTIDRISIREARRKAKAFQFPHLKESGITFYTAYCKLTNKECYITKGEKRFYLGLLDGMLSLEKVYPEFCPASKFSEKAYKEAVNKITGEI